MKERVTVDAIYNTRTELAVCITQGERELWLPVHRIHEQYPDLEDLSRGDEVALVIDKGYADYKALNY